MPSRSQQTALSRHRQVRRLVIQRRKSLACCNVLFAAGYAQGTLADCRKHKGFIENLADGRFAAQPAQSRKGQYDAVKLPVGELPQSGIDSST